MKRIGIDIGGTFTDFVLFDDATSRSFVHKRLTDSEDPAHGVVDGLSELAELSGCHFGEVDMIIHATTLVTNAVLERRGSNIALLATKGFRDILQIQRQKRHDLYNLLEDKPIPLVPRRHTWEVTERIDASGGIVVPLEADELARTVQEIRRHRIDAIAISFMHAYANPVHEQAARAIVRELAPDMPICISSDVSPIIREYERTNTTVVNAYVLQLTGEYLDKLSAALERMRYHHPLFVMHSSGGILDAKVAARFPVRIIESGPAAGVLMARDVAGRIGERDVLSFDMGGTTAKICLITGGQPAITQTFEIDRSKARRGSGLPISLAAIDLVEIGRGGGSIARAAKGLLTVGPDSASASPGPACYGHGGEYPTVTDADLVLGYLGAGSFLGGRMRLSLKAAKRAIAMHVADPLGISITEAAWAIHAVVNSSMSRAARLVTIEQGHDPRAITLVAFGGAGPVHASRIARELRMRRIVVPLMAGVASARGLLVAEISFDFATSRVLNLSTNNWASDIAGIYSSMKNEALAQVQRTGMDVDYAVDYTADLRYAGQGHEISVPIDVDPATPGFQAALITAFHKRYKDLHGIANEEDAEAVTWRLRARCLLPALSKGAPQVISAREAHAGASAREAYLPEIGQYVGCGVYNRYTLRPGTRISGPALVEEGESTILILPGDQAHVDEYANLIIELEPEAGV